MSSSDGAVTTMKHWRAFGPAEWRHVAEGAKGLALGTVLPVVLFYATLRLWSFTAAVVVVLAWSSLVFGWHRWRTAHSDVFSAVTFCFACFQALIGLLSQDPTVYLAMPSLENVCFGSAFLGSALFGRPLLALYARRLYPIPVAVQRSEAFRRAFLIVSAGWFVALGLRALVRLWLLLSLPLEWYLVVNTVAGWPFNVGLVLFTVWYPVRQLRRAGLIAGAPAIADNQEAVEEAVPGAP